MDLAWIFWLFFILGVGGCLGSFMNVVIYRLPRDIPLGRPRWSFCPQCRKSIKWYDNIPVISYFNLGARCRFCRAAITPRYLVVEVITLLAFVILFDAFFLANIRDGIVQSPYYTASHRFYQDWPIYLAHAILFTCLIGMSAIDLEAYWVDIRFTHFAAACGFVLHAMWTPRHSPTWPRPEATISAAALAATVGAIIVYLIMNWYWARRMRAEKAGATDSAGDSGAPDSPQRPEPTAETGPHAEQGPSAAQHPAAPEEKARHFPFSAWIAGVVMYFTLALVVIALIQQSKQCAELIRFTSTVDRVREEPWVDTFVIRVLPGLAFVFLALVFSGMVPKAADQEIEEALEAERSGARKVALTELGILLLPMVMFGVAYFLVRSGGPLEDAWSSLWHWRIRRTQPFMGLGTAATGFVIAAAIGWAIRIGFTLILGKEAFGAGDIHIMAAAGAVAGWEIVAVGFFLAALLALMGWLLTLPFKRGHALPMGPWLTLAIFIIVLAREPVIDYIEPSAKFVMKQWFGSGG